MVNLQINEKKIILKAYNDQKSFIEMQINDINLDMKYYYKDNLKSPQFKIKTKDD